MPSLESHAGGFRVRYREGGRGSPNKASRTYDTKREALQAKADITRMLAARAGLGSRTGTRLPFLEVIERWKMARPDPDGPYVKEARTWLLATAKERSWLTTADLTPAAVTEWKVAMDHLNSRRWAVLRGVLRWASEHLEQPTDPRALVLLRPRPSRAQPPVGLPSPEMVAEWQAKGASQSPSCAALVHCLSVYGWRPVTAARLRVGAVDLQAMRINLGVLKGGNAWSHPIFPATARLLAPLLGRSAHAPLFTAPRTGAAWGERYGIVHWWRRSMTGRIYDLKRFAISTMRRGREPWSRALSVSEIQLFTGHLTASQVLVYLRADAEDLAEIMGCAPGVHGASPGVVPGPDTG